MYDYIEGELVQHSATRLVVDVGGVGYELAVPLAVGFGEVGRRTRVSTHLVVREDAHTLYGFPDEPTRELFRALITVKGVGPRMALGVLSGMSRRELLEAVAGGHRARLVAVKGVGGRTADQILLDLSDRARLLLAAEDAGAGPSAALPERGARIEDAVAALISIGYGEKDARKQVERAAAATDPDDLEALVRNALGHA